MKLFRKCVSLWIEEKSVNQNSTHDTSSSLIFFTTIFMNDAMNSDMVGVKDGTVWQIAAASICKKGMPCYKHIKPISISLTPIGFFPQHPLIQHYYKLSLTGFPCYVIERQSWRKASSSGDSSLFHFMSVTTDYLFVLSNQSDLNWNHSFKQS